MAEQQPPSSSMKMNDSSALKKSSSDTSSSESTVPNLDVCGSCSCIRITDFLHLRSPRSVDAVTDDINLTKKDVDTMDARTNEKTPLVSQKKSSRPPRYPSPPSEDLQSETLARTPTLPLPRNVSRDLAIITNELQSAGLSMPILCRSPPASLQHLHLISTANIDTPLLSLNSRSFARNFETTMPPVPLIQLKMRRRKETFFHHIDQDPETMDPRQTISGFFLLRRGSGRKRAARELKFEERK